MCELLVGLPAVSVLGIVDEAGGPLWIHVETRAERPACAGCGGAVVIKDRPWWSWWISLRSDGQLGSCGASTGGAV